MAHTPPRAAYGYGQLMPKEKPAQEPAPASPRARDIQAEVDALREKLDTARAAFSKAAGYVSTIRLSMEGAQRAGQENYIYNIYSMLHVIQDLERWVIQAELALREEEAQETMH